jgi:hypothetical protein
MPVTECRVAHVRQLDVALGARVHEQVALGRMEFGGRDDFCQLFHVDWLDIDDI